MHCREHFDASVATAPVHFHGPKVILVPPDLALHITGIAIVIALADNRCRRREISTKLDYLRVMAPPGTNFRRLGREADELDRSSARGHAPPRTY
jgi:hypothetical protein